jgi:hypothetical protein
MRKFLRLELDQYLSGRGQERNEENPLYKVDPNQGYIHYRKGSLVMYRLQDDVGENNVDAAIREFLKMFAFKDGPYPVSLHLEDDFQQFTPPQNQQLFEDLFRTITLYDVRALRRLYSAFRSPTASARFYLTVEAKRSAPMDADRSIRFLSTTGSTLACRTPTENSFTCKSRRSIRIRPTSLSRSISCRLKQVSILWASSSRAIPTTT